VSSIVASSRVSCCLVLASAAYAVDTMQASPLVRAPRLALVALFPLVPLVALPAACHVDAHVKAQASVETRNEPSTTTEATTEATTAPPPEPARTTSAQASTPPADACPLLCHEARGAEQANLTDGELAQLRTALEPLLGRLRQCVSPEEWRRHGSPTMTLRLAPDGTLAELGLDPDQASQSLCFEQTGQGASASVTLPRRKVVRCHERCGPEAKPQRGRRAR
jgi:hypothetical protein